MSIFKYVFGNKEKKQRENSTLSVEKQRETKLLEKFNSIYPYFKQFLPISNATSPENLLSDVIQTDKTKVYSAPDLKFVVKNICADLNCFYIYDNELGFEIIQEEELDKLKISKEELHEIALSNYRKLISKKLKAQSNSEAFWFILDGNLEASLILVDEIWDQIEEQVKEDIVVCVPSRDVIIATGKSKTKVIEDFSEKAKEILLNGDHTLSKNWFVRENKEWKIFKEIID